MLQLDIDTVSRTETSFCNHMPVSTSQHSHQAHDKNILYALETSEHLAKVVAREQVSVLRRIYSRYLLHLVSELCCSTICFCRLHVTSLLSFTVLQAARSQATRSTAKKLRLIALQVLRQHQPPSVPEVRIPHAGDLRTPFDCSSGAARYAAGSARHSTESCMMRHVHVPLAKSEATTFCSKSYTCLRRSFGWSNDFLIASISSVSKGTFPPLCCGGTLSPSLRVSKIPTTPATSCSLPPRQGGRGCLECGHCRARAWCLEVPLQEHFSSASPSYCLEEALQLLGNQCWIVMSHFSTVLDTNVENGEVCDVQL